jgi:hypothetical protein
MTKKITVGTESFNYPITGDSSYGEGATDTIVALAGAVGEFFGPGDIKTSETALADGTTADVTGLSFDISFVQRIQIKGFITRTFISSPDVLEAFTIEGVLSGSEFVISKTYDGEDTEVVLFMTGGQVRYTSLSVADTNTLTIKYQASTIIDEDAV